MKVIIVIIIICGGHHPAPHPHHPTPPRHHPIVCVKAPCGPAVSPFHQSRKGHRR